MKRNQKMELRKIIELSEKIIVIIFIFKIKI